MDWLSANRSIVLLMGLFVACYMTGCLIPLIMPLFSKQKERAVTLSLFCAGLGSFATLATGIVFALSPMTHGQDLPFSNFYGGLPVISLQFFADRLAAFFLILTGGISLAAALHMVSWLHDVGERGRVASVFNLFTLTILLTILVNNVYFYLVALEGITMAFAYLALFRHNLYLERENISSESMEASKTAFKSYLIFEHVGLMLLVLAFLLLSVQPLNAPSCISTGGPAGDRVGFNFDLLRCAAQHRGSPGAVQALIFLLALAGFGIKAGVFPGHVWVPMVHPYSPTSIHAMMSGIVLKVAGLYGMYRFFFEFIGPVEWWWGLLVLLLAGATALVGVFYALVERDLKTSLASHSVENIGIILFGIGLALIYRWAAGYVPTHLAYLSAANHGALFTPVQVQTITLGFRLVEALALVASLYHLLNHSVFKSLLFFATGAIENRTGVTALDRLGGLMKRYPWTSTAFLVGAVSIAGFPPFNGFISEWLTLQSLFSGMDLFLPGMLPRIYLLVGMILALLLLALAFGMTALAFVKIAGETLLGAPRDPEVVRRSRPGDVPWHMRFVLVFLAVLCLSLGLFPAPVARSLTPVALDLSKIQERLPEGMLVTDQIIQPGTLNLVLAVPMQQIGTVDQQGSAPKKQVGSYQTRISGRMLWFVLVILLLPLGLRWAVRRSRWKDRYPLPSGSVWTGGTPYQPETMQYTGAAFSSLIWLPFQARFLPAFFRPKRSGEAGPVYLPAGEPVTERRTLLEIFRLSYDRLLRVVIEWAQAIGDWVQNGDIRRYLLYIFFMFSLVLVALLVLNGRGR